MTRKRHQPRDNKEEKNEWPEWFIEPKQPVESEILEWVLQRNEKLADVYFSVITMQINYELFKRNYEELVVLLEKFNNPMTFQEVALNTDKGRAMAMDAMIEFTRRLHNFLASVKMLIDVTRNWIKEKFEKTQFMVINQSEIDRRFKNNVQAQFLEDLRNFTLHRKLPLSIPQLRMDPIGEHQLRSSLGLVLIKSDLLEWKNWSEYGSMQLQMEDGDEVDIRPIVDQYFENVTDYTKWLSWQLRKEWGNEVDQINSVITGIRENKQ